jgi:hypothetical protein
MQQTATGLIVIGWKVALALVAGSGVVTTIGVFLLARFTSVFDAYAGERARLTAQFHNLDRLVEQTEKLTATTEAIKARVSDEVWDRQMRWNFKKDMYIRLMETIGQHMGNHEYNMHLESVRRKNPNNALYPSARDEAIRRSQIALMELNKVACSAPLVISSESHRILVDTQRALRQINFDMPDFEKDCQHNLAVLQDGLDSLLRSSQKDLGIQTL